MARKLPPSHARFQTGTSGNPGGRPKGRRNSATFTKEALNRRVRVRSGDDVHEMRAVEAIFRVLVNKATQGNTRAASLINKLREIAGIDVGITDDERQKRSLRLPRSQTLQEYDLLRAPAREGERQRYIAMIESSEDDSDPSDAPASIPPAIKSGDRHAANHNIDDAMAAYRAELMRCKTDLTADRGNVRAQGDFRRALGRIGVVARELLFAGDFVRARAVADEGVAEAASGFWVVPEVPVGDVRGANTLWIGLVRAHALAFLDCLDEARNYFLTFQTSHRDAATSWESVILRDFCRLRRSGHSHPLMIEVEKEFRARGWLRDRADDIPSVSDRDLGRAADIDAGDALAKQGKPSEALAQYRRVLTAARADLEHNHTDRGARRELFHVVGRIGWLAWHFLLAGDFANALTCANEALDWDPSSFTFNLYRAHALMFTEARDSARAIYFQYHGAKFGISDHAQDAIKADFRELEAAHRSHPLMREVENRFAVAIWHERLDGETGESISRLSRNGVGSSVHETANSAPAISAGEHLAARRQPAALRLEANDMETAHKLLVKRKLDAAFVVYQRRIKICQQVLAKGAPNLQATEDLHAAINKISDIALGHVAEGQCEKALLATDYALSVVPHSAFANIRRAHALMFSGKESEAKEIYLRFRQERVTPDKRGQHVVLEDFACLREGGCSHPLMDEVIDLFGPPPSGSEGRSLTR